MFFFFPANSFEFQKVFVTLPPKANTILFQSLNNMAMQQQQVIENIKDVAAKVLPKGSILYLYGSRARGDSHDNSDWDLLVLLDKPTLEQDDFTKYSFPFVEMGWDIGEDIRPHAYTKEEWFNGPHAMFYYNVEADKKVIYEPNCSRLNPHYC